MDALTRDYRAQNLALRAQTLRDLQKLWPALDYRRLDDTFPTFLSAAALLVQRDRNRAAGLASLFLKAHRMNAGVRGDVAVKLAASPTAEQLVRSMHFTTVETVKTASRAGVPERAAMDTAFVVTAGAIGRHVLNAGRDTVTNTIAADPQSNGWMRATAGGCDFCREIAGRGDVYSAETADFSAHDHCACVAVPSYGNDYREVKPYVPSQRFRHQSQRDAHNARTRDWLTNLA